MFDAKSLLEALVAGAHPQRSGAAEAAAGGMGGLGDILGKLGAAAGGQGGGAGGLGDILGKMQQQAGASGGSLMDVLGKVLAQATSGVQEGAGRIGDATGAREAMGRAAEQMGADDMLAKLKELIQQNQLGAGAAMGGLGGLVLGTKAGRSLAGSAMRLGALALIGGLAYKAMQNYQAGKPLITGANALEAAPSGSGFEPEAVSHDTAALMIRAMIAAAAADGRIDAGEQTKILGSAKQGGMDDAAHSFLTRELHSPATPEQLAQGVQSPEEAVQVYTAARFAIELKDQEEVDFLDKLATALGIDEGLADQIDAAARAASGAA